jgi:pilus assembly protein CpaB
MAKQQEKSALPLIAGAIGFGIVAALLAMFYLNAKEAQLKAKYEEDQASTVRVVVANQDLPKGQEITKNLFSARQVPSDFVHDDAIFPGDFDRYIGRSLVANVGRGKTLLKSFMDEDFPRDFSDVVKPGHRAMTITVDDINSIGGFLRPGNRIDIFVNIPFTASGFSEELFEAAKESGLLELLPKDILSSIPGELLDAANGSANPTELLGMIIPDDVIIPVMQNVIVLATGRDPYRETLDALRQPQHRTESQFSHITLEVNPQQAALISMAQDKGDILTLLRNRDDQSASAFTTVGSPDLFTNATSMAKAEKERASRATTAAGVDINGNLVDADGKKLVSRDQLAAAGYSVNEDGQVVDKDGNIVDVNDIVIAADGTIMTKQQLAAAGLSVNASGQIIDKDGNVVDVNDLVVAADGSVLTKEQLAAAGLSVNANGEIVDKDGKVVSIEDIVVAKDGTIMTKEKLAALTAAGYSVNENGEIVDKDGNIVDPNSIVIASDGSVMTKEQLAAAGLSINENGDIVDANGNVVDAGDLITSANGEVLSKKQLAAAGLSVNANGEIIDAAGNVVSAQEITQFAQNQKITGSDKASGEYVLTIGGASEDGIAKSLNVVQPVDKDKATE